jgi:hypothetical protein
MLRFVADANVLISAAVARSPQAPSVLTLDAALDGRLELITSPLLLQEIAMVLARPRLKKYLSNQFTPTTRSGRPGPAHRHLRALPPARPTHLSRGLGQLRRRRRDGERCARRHSPRRRIHELPALRRPAGTESERILATGGRLASRPFATNEQQTIQELAL